MKLPIFVLLLFCFQIVQAQGVTASDSTESTDYLAELKQDLSLEWPKNRALNIVFHGHSVPAGYFKTPQVNTLAAYPHLFLKYLKTSYPTAVINSITTAIGGEQSAQGALRFQEEVLSLKPDLVFIDYALNDRRLGLEKARTAWKSMIKAAVANQLKVVLLTPSPDLREDILDEQTALAKHTRMIHELGQEFHIPVVDVYQQFKTLKESGSDLSNFMSQGNHPNELGHTIILLEIVKTLF
ncbi:MAG: SGNH/GDSL hydrolase family protein [Saprospiraceae bacterium]